MRKIEHSIKYNILSLLFLIAYIGCMFVLVVESLTPGTKSAQKSNAVGNAVGGFINDLGGDQAKEIDATGCNINLGKEHVFSVGENYKLNVETYPLDSTHKSYEYYSSDETIATVSKNGMVTFVSSGTVTIKAINTVQKEIYDEVALIVNDIMPTKLTTTILNATYNEELNCYEVEKNVNYKIDNLIEPDNATRRNVKYNISDKSKVSIKNDIIYPKEVCDNLIIIEAYITEDVKNSILLKINAKEVIEEKVNLESITSNNINTYVDQTSLLTPYIKYNPTYTSTEFKGYVLESLDTSICTIKDNKIKVMGVSGNCQIKITSKYDSNISTTITVYVENRSNITNFDVNYSKIMYVNDRQRLSIKNIRPTDSKLKSFTINSLDTSIIEVESNGYIKAKSTGSCNMEVTAIDSNNHSITKTISITVNEKPLTIVDDFTINYVSGETPALYMGDDINLKNYFKISKFYNLENEINPENKNYYFSFDEKDAEVSGSTIKFIKYGLINGYIYYINEDESIVYKQISIYALAKFNIVSDLRSTNYNLSVEDYLDFKIEDEYENQKYHFDVIGTSIKYRMNNKFFRVTASDSGESKLVITPIIDDIIFDSLKYEITFVATDVYTTTLDIKFFNKEKELEYNDDTILYVNSEYNYRGIFDEGTTRYSIVLETEDFIKIYYDSFVPLKAGNLKITFIENCSGIKKEYNFKVRNYIKIESKVYNISGSYHYSDGKIEIINGESANINLAFTKDSTYKTVTYKSTDENILKVYEDGTIEPKKQGEAEIILTVNDGFEFQEYTIKFIVHKKNIIDNMTQFMYYVRKGLGHFGAFLILAIFASLTYAFIFRGRLYFVGVAINFAFGFLFAGFTEYLQTLTPGRVGCMSDIIIDYSGYISSAITITIIFTIIYVVKFFKNRTIKTDNSIESIALENSSEGYEENIVIDNVNEIEKAEKETADE